MRQKLKPQHYFFFFRKIKTTLNTWSCESLEKKPSINNKSKKRFNFKNPFRAKFVLTCIKSSADSLKFI